jgi:hypothetical protein
MGRFATLKDFVQDERVFSNFPLCVPAQTIDAAVLSKDETDNSIVHHKWYKGFHIEHILLLVSQTLTLVGF